MTAGETSGSGTRFIPGLRIVADILTAARFATALFIICLAMFVGPQAMPAALIAVFVGWLTDIFDGPLARKSGRAESLLMSRVDCCADMSLAYSFFLFVVVTGLFPVLPAVLLLVAAGTIIAIRPNQTTAMIVTSPVSLLPLALCFQGGLIVGTIYMVTLAILLIFRWDRLLSNAREAREEVERSL